MHVRRAAASDIGVVVALSRRVQEALDGAGIRQQFGPLPYEVVARYIKVGGAFLLDVDSRILGGVFVERVLDRRDHAVWRWGVDAGASPVFFLEKLMIDPEQQGRGLGRILLDEIRADLTASENIRIVLDCWAGNDRLRSFYERAGFRLLGVFPEGSYEIAAFIWP
jgi:ribosomal protein S18 acetylase RimI-like enzyme